MMEGNTQGTGGMESKTALEFMLSAMERGKLANGLREKETGG